MQWTTTGDRITLPYVAPEDDLQSTPATIKALAEAVVAELELATPVGAISPYMGDVAPDGWLICDGSEYDPADLPELYAVNSAFHAADAPGEFRVPDLRGRAPFGAAGSVPTTDADVAAPFTLGKRYGDARIGEHLHDIINPAGGAVYDGPGSADPTGLNVGSSGNGNGNQIMAARWWRSGSNVPMFIPNGMGRNVPPGTGVNFIVYAGRPTTGISPLSELAPATTRDMIEARLAQAGIGEEEVKMLKEHLEEIKRAEAK